jgi:hypothetical protein
MKKSYLSLLALLFTVGLLSRPSKAQDVFEEMYGAGVHAFFAGKLDLAQELFDEVINAGSQDPRVYYYRGLVQVASQCGMFEAGLGDFEQAAQLEVSGRTSANISKALTRIQGPTRIAIERLRMRARLAAKAMQLDAAGAGPIDPATGQRLDGTPPAGGPGNAGDPFRDDAGMTGGEPSPMPAPSDSPSGDLPSPTPSDTLPLPGVDPMPADDPFGAPAAPSTPPATNAEPDPFGGF